MAQERSFGDIDEVISYIGTLVSRLNEKLVENGKRRILLSNITKDLTITGQNIDELVEDNVVALISLEVREPMSIDKTPFGNRKNWNIHGLTFERYDEFGHYERTDHVYRYDNMIVFYVLDNDYIRAVDKAVYLQTIMEQLAEPITQKVAERMFFWEYTKNTTGNLPYMGTKILSEYVHQGLDYIGIAYYVCTRQTRSEYSEVIKNIAGEIFLEDQNG